LQSKNAIGIISYTNKGDKQMTPLNTVKKFYKRILPMGGREFYETIYTTKDMISDDVLENALIEMGGDKVDNLNRPAITSMIEDYTGMYNGADYADDDLNALGVLLEFIIKSEPNELAAFKTSLTDVSDTVKRDADEYEYTEPQEIEDLAIEESNEYRQILRPFY